VTGRVFFSCLGLVLLMSLSACTAPTHSKTVVGVHSPGVVARIIFSDAERTQIKQYYYTHPSQRHPKPYGHRPGHPSPYGGYNTHRPYQLHQPLPPHIAYQRLPHTLEHNFARLPADYVRIVIGGDVLIMNVRTRVLYDAIWDVY
jgi:hypothetical protein